MTSSDIISTKNSKNPGKSREVLESPEVDFGPEPR